MCNQEFATLATASRRKLKQFIGVELQRSSSIQNSFDLVHPVLASKPCMHSPSLNEFSFCEGKVPQMKETSTFRTARKFAHGILFMPSSNNDRNMHLKFKSFAKCNQVSGTIINRWFLSTEFKPLNPTVTVVPSLASLQTIFRHRPKTAKNMH
jgi:hypothetical protein